MCYWNGRTTIDWMFSTAYSGDAKWNDAHWKNERFDKLLKEARVELDEKKRAEYKQTHRSSIGQMHCIWPFLLYYQKPGQWECLSRGVTARGNG